MFEDVPRRNRVTGRGSGHPPASYGLNGPKGGTNQPTRGLVRPSTCLDSPREGKGGGLAPHAFTSHGRKERGGCWKYAVEAIIKLLFIFPYIMINVYYSC